jgi:hypothetical protein
VLRDLRDLRRQRRGEARALLERDRLRARVPGGERVEHRAVLRDVLVGAQDGPAVAARARRHEGLPAVAVGHHHLAAGLGGAADRPGARSAA